MAISGKEAARQVIEHLPDEATLEDIMYALYVRQKIEEGLRDAEAGNLIDHETVMREIDEWLRSSGADRAAAPDSKTSLMPGVGDADDDSDPEDVTYHLEREGWATVLVPDRPALPLTVDLVNELIDEMQREREDRWLGGIGKNGK